MEVTIRILWPVPQPSPQLIPQLQGAVPNIAMHACRRHAFYALNIQRYYLEGDATGRIAYNTGRTREEATCMLKPMMVHEEAWRLKLLTRGKLLIFSPSAPHYSAAAILADELGRNSFPFRMLLMTPRYSGALSTGNFQPACHLTVTQLYITQ